MSTKKSIVCIFLIITLIIVSLFLLSACEIEDTNTNQQLVDDNSHVKDITEVVVAIAALAALILSILNIKIDKTKTISDTVSKSRIEWMNDLRNNIVLFIDEYTKENSQSNKKELQKYQMRIELFLRQNVKIYTPFQESLRKCVNESYSDSSLEQMVMHAQELLDAVWQRIKRESGISYQNEKKVKQGLKKQRSVQVVQSK